ncbi:DUF3151 domain-containing protein [soil metagenome]
MPDLPLTEPLETRVEEPEGSLEQLASASSPEEVRAVAARWPACLSAWGRLGDAAMAESRPVDAYAFYRVGYHRGLDRIRQAGWRGAGVVPWAHHGNRGFLSCLAGLSAAAGELSEMEEARRCWAFLEQLAPDRPG